MCCSTFAPWIPTSSGLICSCQHLSVHCLHFALHCFHGTPWCASRHRPCRCMVPVPLYTYLSSCVLISIRPRMLSRVFVCRSLHQYRVWEILEHGSMSTLLGYRSAVGSRIHGDGLCPISSAYYGYIFETLPSCYTYYMPVYYARATSPQGQTCSIADIRSSPHSSIFS